MFIKGSICLSDIPKELFKKASNGKTYLSIAIMDSREPKTYENADGSTRTFTHYAKVLVPSDQREKYGNIYIGNFESKEAQQVQNVTTEDLENAPAAEIDDLPF